MGLNFLGPKMALAIAHAKKGAKKVSGPAKSLDFVPGPFRMLDRDNLKSLNRSHLVILQGWFQWFDNTTPHLQHCCIYSYNKLYTYVVRYCIAPLDDAKQFNSKISETPTLQQFKGLMSYDPCYFSRASTGTYLPFIGRGVIAKRRFHSGEMLLEYKGRQVWDLTWRTNKIIGTFVWWQNMRKLLYMKIKTKPVPTVKFH